MRHMSIFLLAGALLLSLVSCAPAEPAAGGGDPESSTSTGAPVQTPDPPPEDSSAPVEAPDDAEGASAPEVFMTTDLSAEGLMAVYEALNASPTGNIAIKLSTGEPGSNYLRTDLIGPLVQSFDNPTIVECNTAYGGSGPTRPCTIRWRRTTATPPSPRWTSWTRRAP